MAKDLTHETQRWIWQRPDWPHFDYDERQLFELLKKFDFNNQISLRDNIMFENSETDEFVVSIQGIEALKTSEIEGENYDLSSLKNSFKIHASIMSKDGIPSGNHNHSNRRKSISALMLSLYKDFAEPLDNETLHKWNRMLIEKGGNNKHSGHYRDYAQAMQIRSSTNLDKVEFEAPPSDTIEHEMNEFIKWYNDTGPDGTIEMHPVIRAGLAHLHFVAIHPYDDGNGRIARALAVKVISEHNNEPTLISLSHAIADNKSAYYDALTSATKHGDIDAWLKYFCETAVKAQEITKAKLYQAAVVKTHGDRHDLNEYQKNAINHVIEGRCKKGISSLTVSDYVQINKPKIQERARNENEGLMDIARKDLEDLRKKKVFKLSEKEGKPRYILVYPRTPGISQFFIPKSSHSTREKTLPFKLNT